MAIENEAGAVLLKCGSWTAVVIPQVGMNLSSIEHEGRELLRKPSSLEELKENSVIFGNPLQLPANRTEQARFTFDGRSYVLPMTEPARFNNLHGELHRSSFKITEQDEKHVTASYENCGEIYPFPFQAEVKISVSVDGVTEHVTIKNTGNSDMPLAFGMHTMFNEPECFSVPLEKLWEVNEYYIPTGRLRALTEKERRYTTGATAHNEKVTGFFKGAGHTAHIGNVEYTVSDNFDCWVLWNREGRDGFLAIEPQQGAVNALNNGFGLIRLKPGESEQFTVSFKE